jgi:hypothetical protein
MDVEATTAIRQAEVGAAKTMLDRTAEQFEVAPSRLVADAGYGSAKMVGWLADERGIEPHAASGQIGSSWIAARGLQLRTAEAMKSTNSRIRGGAGRPS